MDKRYLIVNADDFGLSSGVNRGIVEAYENGIVTSTSLMVRGAASGGAADYSRKNPGLSLGLHVDLGEWMFQDDEWEPVYVVVPETDPAAVREEVDRQLRQFRRLVGRDPTHLDSHQHVHSRQPVQSILVRAADALGVPLRHFSSKIQHCGAFYGQTTEGVSLPEVICVEGLLDILQGLPPGVTEMACHAGYGDDLDTMYASERKQEVQVLCDSEVSGALDRMGIELCSFGNLPSGVVREI